MPFNGSGTFLRVRNWVNDAAANIRIRADRHDSEDDNFALGLSQCITKDGQTTITADLPMASFRHTNVGEAQALTQYARYNQVMSGKSNWSIATGTADALEVNHSIPFAALADGMEVNFRASAANTTTTPTLQVDLLGAKVMKKSGGSSLLAGDLQADMEVTARYNLPDDYFEIVFIQRPYVIPIDQGGTGATTAADAQINLGIVPSRDIQGGIISNNTTDAEHDIDVTALTCLDSTFSTVMSVPAITKALDVTFAEGTGNGGMASGEALPTSGTIHIWAITKADGTGDVFANNDAASGLSPSLPSGFDNIRYLGSLITDSSANIVGIRHDGDMFELTDTSTNDIEIGSGVPTTPTAYGAFVPSGVPVMHRASYSMGSTANSSIRVRSPIDTDISTPSLTNCDLRCTASSVGAQSELTRYTENGQIVIHRGENDPTAGFRGKTYGWRNLARGVI